jgi:hypothetical protein
LLIAHINKCSQVIDINNFRNGKVEICNCDIAGADSVFHFRGDESNIFAEQNIFEVIFWLVK